MATDPPDLEREKRVHRIFMSALDLSAGERGVYLDTACNGDEALRAAVERLLAARHDSNAFLDRPALADRRSAAAVGAEMLLGRTVGAFEIIDLIGSGGMGTVYRARQDKPRRDVALKVMHAGLVVGGDMQRFDREVEILARLHHPGIAAIHAAGVQDLGGIPLPYLAMELVPDARTLVEYADAADLDLRERVGLFLDVCDAVHHGHRNGVIHRDLKPANLLVDGEGLVRVIDFGIARATEQAVSLTGPATAFGQMVGTLPYMSPEQCAGAGAADVRSDVYSLGIVLYELLAGDTPFDVDSTSMIDAARAIRDDPPRRPSSIRAELTGDLEAVILTTLAKDPDRRYQSVPDLARDLRHILAGEPIEARVPGAIEHLRLFARRHRALVSASIAVAAVVVVALPVSVAFAVSAAGARDRAEWQSYIGNVAAAESAWRAGDVKRMWDRLAQAPERHRDWEWHYLDARKDEALSVFDAHGGMAHTVAVSPDGMLVATGARDGRLLIWLRSDASIVRDVRVSDYVNGAAFSPDGSRVAAGTRGDAMTARLIVAGIEPDGEVQLLDSTHEVGITNIAWIDDTHLVTAGRGGCIGWWDLGSSTAMEKQTVHEGEVVLDVVRSPAGDWIATSSRNGAIAIVDTSTRAIVRRLPAHGIGSLRLAVRSDGEVLFSCGSDGRLVWWRTHDWSPIHEIRAHTGSVRALALSEDDSVVATGSGDYTIGLWDSATGAPRRVLRGHSEAIDDLAFVPGGNELISASWDRTVRRWAVGGARAAEALEMEGRVYALEFSPDGSRLAAAGTDGRVHVWSMTSREEIVALEPLAGEIRGLGWADGGRSLWVGAVGDDTIRRCETTTWLVTEELSAPRSGVFSLHVSPAETWLAIGTPDGMVRAVDLRDPERVFVEFEPHGRSAVRQLAIDEDHGLLASVAHDGSVHLSNLEDGALIHDLRRHEEGVYAVSFAPDGKHLVSGGRDQRVVFWDLESGELMEELLGHGQFIGDIDFHPRATRMLTVAWNRSLKLWDLERREVVLALTGHLGAIRTARFSPDGSMIATGSHDGRIRLWEKTPTIR